MSLWSGALTTLENAKLVAGVTGTSSDALLELLIDRVSKSVLTYLDRKLAYGTYAETLPATARQLMLLREWPIISIVSITDKGASLALNIDYRCDEQDALEGVVYKEDGWNPVNLVSGLVGDIQAAARTLVVSYTAGWYLPADPHYVLGSEPDFTHGIPGSLPLDIQQVVDEMVAERFLKTKTRAHGATQYKEGEIAYNWRDPTTTNVLGISDEHAAILSAYRRSVIA
jgi:hypothetical protein